MTPWIAARQAPLSVLHHLPELIQSHVHQVSDAIQPSHPLLPPSSVLNLSPNQGLFQWGLSNQGLFRLFAGGGQNIGASVYH